MVTRLNCSERKYVEGASENPASSFSAKFSTAVLLLLNTMAVFSQWIACRQVGCVNSRTVVGSANVPCGNRNRHRKKLPGLCQNLIDHLTVYICQATFQAIMVERETFVIQAH